jgi:hypothetical protein
MRQNVRLGRLGGVSELEGDPPSAGADLRIALAGPVLRAALWRRYGDRGRAAISAARSGRYLGVLLAVLGIAELLVTGDFLGGLWLMVIGWFLSSAAAAEEAAVASSVALRGLCVADVMTLDPEIAPGWMTVADFAGRIAAARSAQRAFPVLSSDARLAGVVITAELARLSRDQRVSRRVQQAALPVPDEYLAAPGDPASRMAARSPLGGEVVAVVLDHSRIVGMVTTGDMHQARLRHRLLAVAPRQGPPQSQFGPGTLCGAAPGSGGLGQALAHVLAQDVGLYRETTGAARLAAERCGPAVVNARPGPPSGGDAR